MEGDDNAEGYALSQYFSPKTKVGISGPKEQGRAKAVTTARKGRGIKKASKKPKAPYEPRFGKQKRVFVNYDTLNIMCSLILLVTT